MTGVQRSRTPPGILVALLHSFAIWPAMHSYFAYAGSCEPKSFGSREEQFTIKYLDRRIGVIGWYHGNKERELAELAGAEAINFAKQGKCDSAKQRIDEYLKRFHLHALESRRVLQALEDLYSQESFSVIGLEYSPEQYKNAFVIPDPREDISTKLVSIFERLCPKVACRFMELAIVFPGPEFEFVRRKKGVRLVPMGSHKLDQASLAGVSEESKNFSGQLSKLTRNELKAYGKHYEMLKAGKPLSKSDIEGILVDVPEPGKTKLRKYFSEISHLMSFVDQRNEHIMGQAIAEKQNVTLVVGNYHVPGLRHALEKRCKSPLAPKK